VSLLQNGAPDAYLRSGDSDLGGDVDPRITPFGPADVEWAAAALSDAFGAPVVVSRGVLRDPLVLPGFVAWRDGLRAGLVTYDAVDGECEVVSINGPGVGAVLLEAAVEQARRLGCHRIWLVTTNDNTRALRFYQRQGWDLVALHRDAVTAGRRLKPSIPELGLDGIPIRHELELERRLGDADRSSGR
jgi:GNAT superfamily N-acetyltransferase